MNTALLLRLRRLPARQAIASTSSSSSSSSRLFSSARNRGVAFDWQDPLCFDSCLTDEERIVRDTTRKYAQEKLLPRVVAATRNEHFDVAIMKEMGELGLLGSSLDGYGCAGLNSVCAGLIAREVESVDSGYRSALSVQSSLCMLPIHKYGPEALKQRLLPAMAAGRLIGAFGLTEPNAGSNPAEMSAKAVRDGDSWVLNGLKTWISNAPIADVYIVWAKDAATQEVRGFVLEKGMPGLTSPKIEGKMALRVSPTGMIVMEDVRVPASNCLDVVGLKGFFSCLDSARFGIAWGAIGAAEFCYRFVRDYSLNRSQFGAPLAACQLVQLKLADMATEISLALQAVLHVSRLRDSGRANPAMTSLLKRNSTLKSLKVARDARDILGGNGIVDEYHVMRHMCNLEAVVTYEGTADIHALILGRALTGISAFSRSPASE